MSNLTMSSAAQPPRCMPSHTKRRRSCSKARARREVLAQTCAINFAAAPAGQLIYTRVAGVSCAILPALDGNPLSYRIWVDPSYAGYLAETLANIATELTTYEAPKV